MWYPPRCSAGLTTRLTNACGSGPSADTKRRAISGLPGNTGITLATAVGPSPLRWNGQAPNGATLYAKLEYATDTKIIRFKKIVAEANPFDEKWMDYFEEREGEKMLNGTKGREKLLSIWRKQQKCCPVCGDVLNSDTGFRIHIPTGRGARKIMVHPDCHKQIHSLFASFEPGPA